LNKVFLHVDLDAFFASVEQLDNPEYRNKPVIVGGLPDDRRAVVSTASYEARKFGVHSAMPIFQAYKLCPHGIFLRGRMKRYHEKSEEVMAIFKEYSPDIQQISVGVIWATGYRYTISYRRMRITTESLATLNSTSAITV